MAVWNTEKSTYHLTIILTKACKIGATKAAQTIDNVSVRMIARQISHIVFPIKLTLISSTLAKDLLREKDSKWNCKYHKMQTSKNDPSPFATTR